MSTRLRATLEAAIEAWVNRECEKEDWPNFYSHPELAEDMASAAFVTMMTSVRGQQYAETEEGSDA